MLLYILPGGHYVDADVGCAHNMARQHTSILFSEISGTVDGERSIREMLNRQYSKLNKITVY